MRNIINIVVIVALSSAATYATMRPTFKALKLEALEMKATAAEREREVLGYTRYTNYLAVGKQYLSGNSKLLAATVVRDEGLSQAIDRSVLWLSFSGAILMTYQAEYSFGYDLRPDQYDVKAVASGIEVRLQKPILVATPAVTNLKHKVLSGSLMTDEKAATLRLYELTAARVKAQGLEMALEPTVIALCEQRLVQVLRDFIAKQPGVAIVPNISIVYTNTAPG